MAFSFEKVAAFVLRVILFMLVVLAINPAVADPPPNADPALAPWFRSLLQPGTSISCCSVSPTAALPNIASKAIIMRR